MAGELKQSRAVAETLGVPGRVTAGARGRLMLVDSSGGRSGVEPEALTAGELFLSALIGCGAVIVESAARKNGVKIEKAVFSATSSRYSDNLAKYTAIDIEVEVIGATQAEAESLVKVYQDECPIYGLAATASKVSVKIKGTKN